MVAGQVSRLFNCGTFSCISDGAPASRDDVRHAILLVEGALAFQAALLIGLLEIQIHDGEAFAAICLVELDQILGFVMAIGTPGAGDDGHHDFAFEARIVIGDQFSFHVGKSELECRIRIARGRMGEEIVRRGQSLGLGDIGAIGGQHGRAASIGRCIRGSVRLHMLLNFQGPVRPGRDHDHPLAVRRRNG